jgi:hypothetical protein
MTSTATNSTFSFQKELDLMRKHSAISLGRFRGIESEMKRGAFALVDKEEALAKAKRDRSSGLVLLVERKERTKQQRVE